MGHDAITRRHIYAIIALILCAIGFALVLHLERNRIVGYWIEHCVDQFRPKFQAEARRGCTEEAERWRYGTEEPFDWEGYEEAYAELERLRAQDGGKDGSR